MVVIASFGFIVITVRGTLIRAIRFRVKFGVSTPGYPPRISFNGSKGQFHANLHTDILRQQEMPISDSSARPCLLQVPGVTRAGLAHRMPTQ